MKYLSKHYAGYLHFLASGPDPSPQPNPNLYLAAPAFNLFLRPLLIKIGKNESQRLSIMLLFYFYSLILL